MARLLWVSKYSTDPEDSFLPLKGRRPAPEPITYDECSPELLAKRLFDLVLIDAREDADAAAALIRKIRNETDSPLMVLIDPQDMADFEWSSRVADFVSSNSSLEELNVRIDRLIAPDEEESDGVIRRGDIVVNRERFEVRVAGVALDLTFKEFELIAYLAGRPGRVCSRRALLSEVWGYDFFGGTRTVDVHVRRIRAKLGSHAHVVETVRNVGYRFAG